MTEYLRSEKARRDAILNDTPDTKFYFESQKFSDIPGNRPGVNNAIQWNEWGAKEVRRLAPQIEAAAARYSVDSNIVKAIIYTELSRGGYGDYVEKLEKRLGLPEV